MQRWKDIATGNVEKSLSLLMIVMIGYHACHDVGGTKVHPGLFCSDLCKYISKAVRLDIGQIIQAPHLIQVYSVYQAFNSLKAHLEISQHMK